MTQDHEEPAGPDGSTAPVVALDAGGEQPVAIVGHMAKLLGRRRCVNTRPGARGDGDAPGTKVTPRRIARRSGAPHIKDLGHAWLRHQFNPDVSVLACRGRVRTANHLPLANRIPY